MKFLARILTALLPLSAAASKLEEHAAKLATLKSRGTKETIDRVFSEYDAALKKVQTPALNKSSWTTRQNSTRPFTTPP